MPATYTGDAATGLDLGFDGRSDWTGNGEMPDLFGGFFFGGPSAEGGFGGNMDGVDFGDVVGGGNASGSESGGWQQ